MTHADLLTPFLLAATGREIAAAPDKPLSDLALGAGEAARLSALLDAAGAGGDLSRPAGVVAAALAPDTDRDALMAAFAAQRAALEQLAVAQLGALTSSQTPALPELAVAPGAARGGGSASLDRAAPLPQAVLALALAWRALAGEEAPLPKLDGQALPVTNPETPVAEALAALPLPPSAEKAELILGALSLRAGAGELHATLPPGTGDDAAAAALLEIAAALLSGMDAAGATLGSLPLVSPRTREAMLAAADDSAAPYDAGASLPALVLRGGRERPDAPALEDAERRLTHAELNRLAHRIGAHVARAVPEPGARIGVALPRDVTLPAALLGVMLAGHAYVPLDPAQPVQRLRQVLEAAGARALLCADPELARALTDGTDRARIDPAEAPENAGWTPPAIDPESAAYVIFTSGSTGTPKGVAIPHRAAVNFLCAMLRRPGIGPGDRLLSVTTAMFDISVLEFFGPPAAGGCTVMAGAEMVRDGFALAARAGQRDITLMQATPTLWAMLLEAGLTPRADLRMLVGGEALPEDLSARLTATGAELWNMYGPTETTVWSACGRVGAARPITIGDPVANTGLYVLDAMDRLCPEGVTGELNIGGDGLALGYHGRPDLTRDAFREVDLGAGPQRLYRTGDLAVRLPGGQIRVLGRRDGQVKLRGYRIELGEIEARLRACDGVAAAAVDLREGPGGKRLVGYVVPQPGAAPEGAALAQALAAELPGYMVPTAWVQVDALPRNVGGKLDRRALPEPGRAGAMTGRAMAGGAMTGGVSGALPAGAGAPATDGSGGAFGGDAATDAGRAAAGAAPVPLHGAAAPLGPVEERLAAIFAEMLGQESVPVTAPLTALGADSLAVFRLAARLIAEGFDVDVAALWRHQTARELAAAIEAGTLGAGKGPKLADYLHGAKRRGRVA